MKLNNLFFLFIGSTLMLIGCNIQPEPIQVGKDPCQYCKMTISDARFGAEAITKKGKIYKYDEAHCIINDLHEKTLLMDDVKEIYVSNFCSSHDLINVKNAFYFRSEALKSPMGGNVAAFASNDSAKHYMQLLSGETTTWDEMIK